MTHPRIALLGGAALAIFTTFAAPSAFAQGDAELLEAVRYYRANATSDFPTILSATDRFERLAVERPDDWRRAYWTSFAYTQLGLFADDGRRRPYVDLARVYFEKSSSRRPAAEPTVEADFTALEGLLYSFLASTEPSRRREHTMRSEAAWERTGRLDEENPMYWMNRAIQLLPDTLTRAEGYTHASRAIDLYELRGDTIRPSWGREFIDVRLRRYPR